MYTRQAHVIRCGGGGVKEGDAEKADWLWLSNFGLTQIE
jgi:hypothetical protein